MYEYFSEYCATVGDQLRPAAWRSAARTRTIARALLHGDPRLQDVRVTATPSAACIARSRRRCGRTSGRDLPVWEVPITSITNGVHLPSWLNGDLATLYDQYLQPDWRERYNEPDDLGPDPRHSGRGTLGSAPPPQAPPDCLRPRTHGQVPPSDRKAAPPRCAALAEVLDPDAFTIGFARRFATYKRATLLFRDVDAAEEICSRTRTCRCRSSSPARRIPRITPARR